MTTFQALVIGAGATGSALTHDLALRGFRVTLLDRGEVTSGTSGRHHGLLHSGGRYAVKDKESARECIEENMILREIMPGMLELNDGLFVALTDEDVAYAQEFVAACTECDIPLRVLTREPKPREDGSSSAEPAPETPSAPAPNDDARAARAPLLTRRRRSLGTPPRDLFDGE